MTTIYIQIKYDETRSRFAWRKGKTADDTGFTLLEPAGATGMPAPPLELSGYKSGTFKFLKHPTSTSTIRYSITRPGDTEEEEGELLSDAGPSVTLDTTTTEVEILVPLELHRAGTPPYIGHFKIKGEDGLPDLIDPSSQPGASWPSPLRPLLQGVDGVADAVASSLEKVTRGSEPDSGDDPR